MGYKADAMLAAKTFMSFSRSPRDKFEKAPISLPWREANPGQLRNFINQIKSAPASTTQFNIAVDRNVPINFHHKYV